MGKKSVFLKGCFGFLFGFVLIPVILYIVFLVWRSSYEEPIDYEIFDDEVTSLRMVTEKDLEFSYTDENVLIKIWVSGFNRKLYKGKKIQVNIPEKISGKIPQRKWNGTEGKWRISYPEKEFEAKDTPIYGIAGGAFYSCKNLESIYFPEGLRSIEWAAFRGCSRIESLSFPESLIKIGWQAFYECPKLDISLLPRGLQFIGNRAFDNALLVERKKALSIQCPPTAFKGNPFPCYVEGQGPTVDDLEFSDDWNLNQKYTLFPEIFISEFTFHEIEGSLIYCYEGESASDAQIYVLGFKEGLSDEEKRAVIIPEKISGIIHKYLSKKYLIRNPNRYIEVIDIPVVGIAEDAFKNFTRLESITFPKSLTSIKDSAFRDCTSLQTIDLPEGLISIEGYSFLGCTSLQTINLPKALTSIGGSAFGGCTSLQTINLPESLTSIGSFAFSECTGFDIGSDGNKKVIVINCSPDVFEEEVFEDIRGKKPNDDTEYLLTKENIEFNYPDWTLAEKKRVFKGNKIWSGLEFTK